jgi:hypothetical protein
MALVVRQVTGPIETPEHVVVTTGFLRVKLLYPIAEDTTFIAPYRIQYTVTAGEPQNCQITTTGWYEFTIEDTIEERIWSFQVMVYPEDGSDISVAELWLQSRTQGGPETDIPPEQIDLSWYGSDGAADGEVLTADGAGGTAWEPIAGSGLGDMLKSVYDTNDDGKVDAADTADTAALADDASLLGGISPSGYQTLLTPATNDGAILTWDDVGGEYTPNDNFLVDDAGNIVAGGIQIIGALYGNVFVDNQVYYLVDDETHILVTTAADAELRLPDPAFEDGRVIEVKKGSETDWTLTLTVVNSKLIDGQATYELVNKYEALTLVAINGEWWIF